MPKTKKKNKKLTRKGRIALIAFFVLLLTIGFVNIIAIINASVVNVRRAELSIPDLPTEFEGTTLLYASDIDLCGINTADRSGKLFQELQNLKPDILILGGDYTSSSVFEIINKPENSEESTVSKLRARMSFFQYISSFEAPLGKFAVASPEDFDRTGLKMLMEECGVTPLFNSGTVIQSGSGKLFLAGFADNITDMNAQSMSYRNNDCVIAVLGTPDCLHMLQTSEAGDGGCWTDVILAGHTHGGQIQFFGRSILPMSRVEQSLITGWQLNNSTPILVTSGIGCEGVNLRLGSSPEVWLITLRCSA